MSYAFPECLTTIDYYPYINHPLTEWQTFDLGVCMEAYPNIWNNHWQYKNTIIMICTFHIFCWYFKMVVGMKMEGSRLSVILMESNFVGTGSTEFNGVPSWKHYDKSMHLHNTIVWCFDRLILQQFAKSRNYQQLLQKYACWDNRDNW